MTEVSEKSKTRGIVAHITLIGWIIAIVQNQGEEKDEFASFYIRQMLGLMALALSGSIIGMIIWPLGLIIHLGALTLWILSLIAVIDGKKQETPVIGAMFQDWFKSM